MSKPDYELIGEVKDLCAELHAAGGGWTSEDGAAVAAIFNEAAGDPFELFRYVDERTGSSDVGYRDRHGREWFHILRQMRNEAGSGLLENLERRPVARSGRGF